MDKKNVILAIKNTRLIGNQQKKVLIALVAYSVHGVTEIHIKSLAEFCSDVAPNSIYGILKALEKKQFFTTFRKQQQAHTNYQLNLDKLNYLITLDCVEREAREDFKEYGI